MNRKKVIADAIPTEPNLTRRILAGFIDYSVIYIFTYAFIFAFGRPNNTGEMEVYNLMILPIIIFWGLITVGVEQTFGATLGNQITGLKPLSINGIDRKLSFGQSLKRHLVDIIDLSPLGLVGIISINKTEKHQRIGDIWAETVVVRDKEDNH